MNKQEQLKEIKATLFDLIMQRDRVNEAIQKALQQAAKLSEDIVAEQKKAAEVVPPPSPPDEGEGG